MQSHPRTIGVVTLWFSLAQCASAAAFAQPDLGKLTATGGISQIEGAGGGGLTPWALITGYGSRDSYGANVHLSTLRTADYELEATGMAIGFADRFELSLSRLNVKGHKAPLDHLDLKLDVIGIKLKLVGDAVYDQDRWLPQIAVGAMVKRTQGIGGLGALGVSNVRELGAARDHGVDYYVAATKLALDQSALFNLTVRATKANQMGLLGFGGDRKDRYQPMLEGSLAYLVDRKTVAGIEYRMKPRNLTADNEKNGYDTFVSYFPNKNLSVTAAWVALGDITVFNPKRQQGLYLSLQAGF